MNYTRPALLLALPLALIPPLAAQTAVTPEPVGYVRATIYGQSTTLVALGVHPAAVYQGVVTAVSTNSVTFETGDLSTIPETGKQYSVEFLDGSGAGLIMAVTGFTTYGITLNEPVAGIVEAGDSAIIRPLATIADIFGTGSTLILAGGTSKTADIVQARNPAGTGTISLFYSTGGLTGTGWRKVGGGTVNYAGTPVYPGDGFLVQKRSAGNVQLLSTGSVRSGPVSILVEQGSIPYGTSFPVGTTLGSSGLYNAADPASSVTAGTSKTADRINVDSDGNGTQESYFYSSGGLIGTGWRMVGGGSTNCASVNIDGGFSIIRSSPGEIVITIESPLSE